MIDLSKFNKRTWLIGALRRLSSRYPPRYATKVEARVERGRYKCNICNEIFRAKEVQIDHIVPVVDPEKGFTNWEDYIERLFCNKEGFQVVCLNCHQTKSEKENKLRRKNPLTKKKKKSSI